MLNELIASAILDVIRWLDFGNGTSIPHGYPMYDAFQNMTGQDPVVTMATDKEIYGRLENTVFVSGHVRNDTITMDQTSVYLVVFNHDKIPHKYHASVALDANGNFPPAIPIAGTFPSDGNYTIGVRFRGQEANTIIGISDSIGNFTTLVQAIPRLTGGGETISPGSDTPLKVEVSYTMRFLASSTDRQHHVSRYVPIVDIRNSEGITEALLIDPGFTTEVQNRWYVTGVWSPQRTDTYSINTFIISDLKQPKILTAIKTSYVMVE